MKLNETICNNCKFSIEVEPSEHNRNNDRYCTKHKIYCSQGDECCRFEKIVATK